jgi:hypothetical protein
LAIRKARDPERLRADLGIPVKAMKVDIGQAIRQFARLDGIQVVDQKQKNIKIRAVQRGRIFGDL